MLYPLIRVTWDPVLKAPVDVRAILRDRMLDYNETSREMEEQCTQKTHHGEQTEQWPSRCRNNAYRYRKMQNGVKWREYGSEVIVAHVVRSCQ
jgi:hypothetical protein